MPEPSRLGTNLRRLLAWHDLSGKNLAALLGATEHAVSGWVRGEREPSSKYLRALGELFDVNPVGLFDDPDAFGPTIADPERRRRVDEERILEFLDRRRRLRAVPPLES